MSNLIDIKNNQSAVASHQTNQGVVVGDANNLAIF